MRISDWSSDVCSSDLHTRPEAGPALHLARGERGLPAVLRQAGQPRWYDDPHGRRRARHHDPPDHHRDLARGLRPDAEAAPGSSPGPGRDALGVDPDDGLPLLPLRHDQLGHARPGPRARRDDGGRPGAGPRRPLHAVPDRQREPEQHRRQHPATLQGRYAGHRRRSEEHTSELQSLMLISYAVFCLKKKTKAQENKIQVKKTQNKKINKDSTTHTTNLNTITNILTKRRTN